RCVGRQRLKKHSGVVTRPQELIAPSAWTRSRARLIWRLIRKLTWLSTKRLAFSYQSRASPWRAGLVHEPSASAKHDRSITCGPPTAKPRKTDNSVPLKVDYPAAQPSADRIDQQVLSSKNGRAADAQLWRRSLSCSWFQG